MRPGSKVAVGAALVAALAGGLWWSRAPLSIGGDGSVGAEATRTGAGTAEAVEDAPITTAASGDPLATGSLRGTEVDGSVRFAADGSVVPDAGLRRLFDYYLSTLGETDLAGVRTLLRRHLQPRFGSQQVERVLALFERYVAYQRALADAPAARAADPAQRLAEARRLRRMMLGEAMAEGFFAEEEALAELGLRRRQIAADASLTAERKRELLDAIDRDAGYGARGEADLAEFAARQAEDIERRQLAPAQRDAERTALWGAEAAQRLAALDSEQAEWDARVRRYAEARARITDDPRLDPSGRAAQIDALRTRMFSAPEQRRIASLEAIGQLQAALSTSP